LTDRLDKQLRAELRTLFDPIATRVLSGEDVKITVWPELAAIKTRYDKSLDVIKPYLPAVRDALAVPGLLYDHIIKILKKLPADPRRNRIRLKLVKLKDVDSKTDLEKWQVEVAARVRDGKPYDKKQVKSPNGMLASYKAAATKIARETK